MAYNRLNYLERIKFIQDFYKRENDNGVSNVKIIEKLKQHNIHISAATFYNYMAIPVKREIMREQAKIEAKKNQPSLFSDEDFYSG
ncbi:MAG: hypothetical protein N4A49_01880 [Marinifilaceae bacterium]|jgi:hypothetical protein|nr:hypothetical protein [Marinifilaceae bacterium]